MVERKGVPRNDFSPYTWYCMNLFSFFLDALNAKWVIIQITSKWVSKTCWPTPNDFLEACHKGSGTLCWLSLCLAVRLSFLERCWEEARERTKSQVPKHYSLSEVQWKQSWFYEIGETNEIQSMLSINQGLWALFMFLCAFLVIGLKEKKEMRREKGNDFAGTSDHFILLY